MKQAAGNVERTTVYYDQALIDDGVNSGRHRDVVGGMWDEIGHLQFEFLRDHGLRPEHKLLDLGCGCLRGGVHFVRYLEPGYYYGIDANQSLLDAGYDIELANSGLADRLPRENLQSNRSFDATMFRCQFDAVVSISLFTHLPANYLRTCLEQLAPVVAPGGRFFASFFLIPDEHPFSQPMEQGAGITTTALADPYHYRRDDLFHACTGLPWSVHIVGDWNHPRNQRMVIFERQADAVSLRPGDENYRAYVGPAERYDLMGASQFALLFQLGLREQHRVLDFGCGSLRLGRLLIPWLQPGNYFGIDPNAWLIEAGFSHELGTGIRALKSPRFSYNDDFDCTVFGSQFDMVVAQSILTHCGPDLCRRFFVQMGKVLGEDGIAVFSYFRDSVANLPADGWHYPECVAYAESDIESMVREAGLVGTSLPWYHPGAVWYAIALDPSRLPNAESKRRLSGLPSSNSVAEVPAYLRRSNPLVKIADIDEANEIASQVGTGHARLLEPSAGVTVSRTTRLVFEYVAGRSTVANGGRIRFCFHHVCSWSPAQTVDSSDSGYVEARSSSGAPLTVSAWGDPNKPADTVLTQFPWQHVIEVVVGAPGLYEGDKVIVTYGAGAAAAQVQSFAANPYQFCVLLDPQCTGTFLPAESHPSLVVSGSVAARLVIVTASDHKEGQTGWVLVRVEDAAGNLAGGFEGTITLEADAVGGPFVHRFSIGDRPVHRFEVVSMQPTGLCRLLGRTDGGLVAQSNPFRVWPQGVSEPSLTLWGEIHGHSTYSDGYGTPQEYFVYARDIAGLDVAALTEHDFMLSDKKWAEVKQACNEANEPGKFVTLQGYEWSGMTDVGGDRNLYFRGDDPPICRSRTLYDYRNPFIYHGTEPGANHVEDLYHWLDDTVGEGEVVVVPQWGGRPANPRWLDPRYDRLIEIYSEHRRSEEWAMEFPRHGVRLGIVAGGDNHIGRPGNGFLSYAPGAPDFSGPKALVAIKANRTRKEVFDALMNHRTYATTGARILIDFEVEGCVMGESISSANAPTVRAEVRGTAYIKQVEIVKDGVVVHVAKPDADPSALQLTWQDSTPVQNGESAYWLNVIQADGHLAVTSPVWVRADKGTAQ